jgi:hypothetical protein
MVIVGVVYTIWCMVAPALLAMMELWLRLFAVAVAPIGIAYLNYHFISTTFSPNKNQKMEFSSKSNLKLTIIGMLTAGSSLILATDTLYVLKYGPHFGASLYLGSFVLAFAMSGRHNATILSMGLVVLAILGMSHSIGTTNNEMKADQQATLDEGLYSIRPIPSSQL